jgi:DNA-binding response OmpR family regulator
VSRRLLVIEPDPASRAMMERALATLGFAPETAASIHDARAGLDGGTIDAAIVDELAGGRGLLDEVRWLRARRSSLPVIVTGTRLAPRTLEEMLRLGAAEALRKPFTPMELREAVARAVARAGALHGEALEYAAALGAAREEIAAGRPVEAARAVARAQAASPLDAEAMALRALLAELDGRDADADRGYRAAIALRQDEDAAPPDPFEGLARLAAYAGARPTPSLTKSRGSEAIWIVTDPIHELPAGPPGGDARGVALLSLGLAASGPGALYLREGSGPRAFALMAGSMRDGAVAAACARIGAGKLVGREATRERIDLDRAEAQR